MKVRSIVDFDGLFGLRRHVTSSGGVERRRSFLSTIFRRSVAIRLTLLSEARDHEGWWRLKSPRRTYSVAGLLSKTGR